jgi:hypothetical protein
MSGGSVGYHLRENKAIERSLFIEVLARVGRSTNISEYTYVGFGGPFLEDFKALHSALRIKKMISIESDPNVCKRQEFNKPATFIDLQNKTSGDFIDSHEFSDNTVVWLDYTAPKELYLQLSEFRSLIAKLGKFDVAKLTLNANPAGLGGDTVYPSNLQAERREILAGRLGDYCKFDMTDDDLFAKNYPSTLLKAVHSCLGDLASRTSGEYFQILSAFVYKDSGHQMLTVTGILLNAKNDADKSDFLEKSRLTHWPFRNLEWTRPIEISVPALSAKERMALDAALPVSSTTNAGEYLTVQLGYCPSEQSEVLTTKLLLDNYAKFYRAFPMFSRVIL